MKKYLNFFFILFLFSCKGESFKKENINNTKANTEFEINEESKTPLNKISENCYDYLTELVRSSNFPFSELKINKSKVNLLIDEENDDIISCKLFFETDGIGTIGWIEYHKKNGKLFNTSADLDNPIELKYDLKWKNLFDSCFSKKTSNEPTPKLITKNALEKIYNDCIELSLPNKYNYDAANEEKGFISIDKEYYSLFSLEHQDNYKMAKLPVVNNVKPVILITYNENGQSTWYLFTLNKEFNPVSNIILYTNIETEKGSKTITYNITKEYEISIIESLISKDNEKIITKKNYSISKEGYIK